jgi:hypothetical protein
MAFHSLHHQLRLFVDVVFVVAVAVIVLLDISSVELDGDVVVKAVLE